MFTFAVAGVDDVVSVSSVSPFVVAEGGMIGVVPESHVALAREETPDGERRMICKELMTPEVETVRNGTNERCVGETSFQRRMVLSQEPKTENNISLE